MNLFLFNKIKQKLFEKIDDLFNKKNIDYTAELNDILLDSGIETDLTDKIISKIKNKYITSTDELKKELYLNLKDILKNNEKEIQITQQNTFTILVIGANGVGKTTTVVKLANFFKKKDKTVIVAAGDTYRAAGIEQLDYLCKKHAIPIIKQHSKADSTAVIFDALNIAKNKNIDILIADTSGRLHTNEKLMQDLKKISISLKKINRYAPDEVLMVVDANFGQNLVKQIEKFNEYINITGIIISKTDTAKGGSVLSLAKKNIPITYICNGEKIENICIFKSKDYIKSLLNI